MYSLSEEQLDRADLTRNMSPETAQQIVDAARALWAMEDERDRLIAFHSERKARLEARLTEVEQELAGIDCEQIDRDWGLTMAALVVGDAISTDVEAAGQAANESYRVQRRLLLEGDGLRALLKQGSNHAVAESFHQAQWRRNDLSAVCYPTVRPSGSLYSGPYAEARERAEREWRASVEQYRKPIKEIVAHALKVLGVDEVDGYSRE